MNCFWRRSLLPLSLLVPLLCNAEHFIDLTLEVQCDQWNWMLFNDQRSNPKSDRSIFTTNAIFHCVVGTNRWFIECGNTKTRNSYWFNGTNILEQISGGVPVESLASVSKSADGNPGRPVRVADRMTFNTRGRICWLAVCSGPCLKRDGRKIFPPDDMWKESFLAFSGWTDKTTVFADSLGLPKSLTLLTTNNQPILQYQVHESTNFLGWNIPLEFYLVQYIQTGTNVWGLDWTAKGKVTDIGIGAERSFPSEPLNPRRMDD
jgi:hypothetical protein